VFEGDFTEPRDKEKIVDAVLGLWALLLTGARARGEYGEQQRKIVAFVDEARNRVFPPHLFGDLVQMLEDSLDTSTHLRSVALNNIAQHMRVSVALDIAENTDRQPGSGLKTLYRRGSSKTLARSSKGSSIGTQGRSSRGSSRGTQSLRGSKAVNTVTAAAKARWQWAVKTTQARDGVVQTHTSPGARHSADAAVVSSESTRSNTGADLYRIESHNYGRDSPEAALSGRSSTVVSWRDSCLSDSGQNAQGASAPHAPAPASPTLVVCHSDVDMRI